MGLLAPCGERARIAGAATAEADCTELSDLGIRRFVPIWASRAMSRSLPARASSEPGGTLPTAVSALCRANPGVEAQAGTVAHQELPRRGCVGRATAER